MIQQSFQSHFMMNAYQEVTRAHKGWALDSVVLQNQTTRYNKEDIHDSPSEGKKKLLLERGETSLHVDTKSST